VSQAYIAKVEIKRSIVVDIIGTYDPKVLIALPNASLSTSGFETAYGYAGGCAGIAMCTVRPIDVVATAAEAQHGKLTVKFLIYRLPRVDKKCGRLLIAQVATAVRVGGVYLEVP